MPTELPRAMLVRDVVAEVVKPRAADTVVGVAVGGTGVAVGGTGVLVGRGVAVGVAVLVGAAAVTDRVPAVPVQWGGVPPTGGTPFRPEQPSWATPWRDWSTSREPA